MEPNHNKLISSFRFMEKESIDNEPKLPHQELLSRQLSHQHTPPRASTESAWSPHHHQSHFHHCAASLRCYKGGSINAIAVLRSGLVVTSSDSPRVRVWRKLDNVERGYIKASSGEVRAMLAFGNMLFTSHKDRKTRVWDLGAYVNGKFSPKKMATLPRSNPGLRTFFSRSNNVHLHKDVVSCMAYYHAEGILYTGSWDCTIKAWKVSELKCIDTFIAHADKITALVVNQEDGCLFSSSVDGAVKIWRRGYGGCSHNLTMTLRFQFSPVNALALSASPSGCFLYSGSSDGYTNFWVKEKLSCRYNHGGFLEGHNLAVTCLAAVGRLVVSGSEDAAIRVWRRGEGSGLHECLAVLEGHKEPVKCISACFESDDVKGSKALFVYSASFDHTFKIWRVNFSDEGNHSDDADTVDDDDHDDHDHDDDDAKACGNLKHMELDVSPVLSPLWVDKKRQVNL